MLSNSGFFQTKSATSAADTTASEKVCLTSPDEAHSLANQYLEKIDNMYQQLDKLNVENNATDDRHYAARVFANNHHIKENFDTEKQTQLLNAYRKGEWNDPVFLDPDFTEIAYALFAKGELQNAEFETLLTFNLAQRPMDNIEKIFETIGYNEKIIVDGKYPVKTFRILDDNNEFTEEAQNLLFPALRAKYMYETFTPVQMNNFKLLMSAFIEKYPGENMFFMVESPEYMFDAAGSVSNCQEGLCAALYSMHSKIPTKALHANVMTDQNAIIKLLQEREHHSKITALRKEINEKIMPCQKIGLSCLVEEALRLSYYPLEDVVPSRSIAGKLTKSDVERCGDVGLRPCFTLLNGIPSEEEIHGIKETSAWAKKDHDYYHAQHLMRKGYALREACKRMKNLSRTELLMHSNRKDVANDDALFAISTWHLVDGEMRYFNPENGKLQPRQSPAKDFCAAFTDEDTNDPTGEKKGSFIFERHLGGDEPDYIITDLGMVTFIDMAKHPEIWASLYFDPNELTGRYLTHFQIAQKLLPYFREDDVKYNLILFRTYLALGEEHLNQIVHFSEHRYESFSSEFQIERRNLSAFLGLVDKKIDKKSNPGFMLSLLRVLTGIDLKTEQAKKLYYRIVKDLREKNPVFDNILLLGLCFPDLVKSKELSPIIKEMTLMLLRGDNSEKFTNLLSECDEFLYPYATDSETSSLNEQEMKMLDDIINSNESILTADPNSTLSPGP